MNELTTKTQTTFKNIFETEASHVIRAPGRVNLIGEHTDYNDGFVFPAALNFATVIAARKRDDAIVKVVSLDYGNEIDEFDTTKKITHSEKPWANYVRGTVKTLIDNGFEGRRCRTGYFWRCTPRRRPIFFGLFRGCRWLHLQNFVHARGHQ